MATNAAGYAVPTGGAGTGLFGWGPPAGQELTEEGYNTAQQPTVNPGLVPVQGATINTAGASPYTAAQQGLMTQLQGEASGLGGPTIAQQQLEQGTNASLASTLAAGASSTRMGQNPGIAAKTADQTMAGIDAGAAGAAASLSAGQQLGAQGALGTLSTAGAGQQLQEAQTQAGLNQEASLQDQSLANQNWQTGTQLNAANQLNYNQAVSGLTSGSNSSSNQLANTLITNTLPHAADGLSTDTGTPAVVGEEGPEAVVSNPTPGLGPAMQALLAGKSGGGTENSQALPILHGSNSSGMMTKGLQGSEKTGFGSTESGMANLGEQSSMASGAAGGLGDFEAGAAAGGDLGALALAADGGHFPVQTPAVVGERGPEVVDLPAGSTVIPHEQSASSGLLDALRGAKAGPSPESSPGGHGGSLASLLGGLHERLSGIEDGMAELMKGRKKARA